MAQQQHPQQPSTPPAPAAGQASGPNMSQVIMQMTAQMTQGQTRFNQAMADIRSQQLQINRNVERSVVDFRENGAVSEMGSTACPKTGSSHGYNDGEAWILEYHNCRQTQIYPNLELCNGRPENDIVWR